MYCRPSQCLSLNPVALNKLCWVWARTCRLDFIMEKIPITILMQRTTIKYFLIKIFTLIHIFCSSLHSPHNMCWTFFQMNIKLNRFKAWKIGTIRLYEWWGVYTCTNTHTHILIPLCMTNNCRKLNTREFQYPIFTKLFKFHTLLKGLLPVIWPIRRKPSPHISQGSGCVSWHQNLLADSHGCLNITDRHFSLMELF